VKEQELELVFAGGRIAHMLIGAVPLHDAEGSVCGSVAAGIDITTRKLAETERDRLFDYSLDILCSIGFDGCFKRVSPSFERILGWKEEETLARTIYDFVHPDDREPTRKTGQTHEAGREAIRFQNRYRTREGSYRWISWNSHPIVEEELVICVGRDITELKQAEQALHESEERFRALLTASSDAVYSMNPDWSEMHFLRGREFIADTDAPNQHWLQKYIHPEDQAHVMAVANQAILTRSMFELEHRVIRVDGSLGWTFSRAIPLHGANGEIAEWFGSASNITERKRAQEALRQSEELLRTFVRNVPAAVAMLDREMRYLQVSERWCSDYSLGADDILGRSHYDVFPDLPERWKEIHRRCLTGETLRGDEDRWERANGSITWLHWEIRPWGEANGRPKGVLLFTEDITPHKRMETTLRESEETIRTLLDTAAQAILAVDSRGIVVLANRMAEEMFGYGRTELLGGPLERLLPERFREKHLSHRAGFAANPRTRPMGIGLDLQGVRRDGMEFPIEISLSSVKTSQETLAVAFVTDVTLRKQAEASLRSSERELRELAGSLITAQEDERRRVARDLHDDVTQRLALLSIDMGKLAAEIPPSVEETRTRLRACQRQALEVADEARRVSHGLHPSVIQDFGLSPALEEFCGEFAKAHGIGVQFECPGDDAGLGLDGASCLYRIVQECLHNAAKHAHATEIRVALTASGGKMHLVVRDNGAGFPAGAHRAKWGLGLVSMKERVRMVNGTLSIASQPGQGTEIAASVPLSGV
jgi:PAS domain S-box-containing protein